MSLRIIFLFIYLFFSTLVFADTNNDSANDKPFQNYVDKKQKVISDKVVNLFDNIDKKISNLFSASNENLIYKKDIKDENLIDQFFKNKKYIDETEKSFLRIRLGTLFQSKDSTLFQYKISARVPLNRTKRNFQLFIDDIEKNYLNNTLYGEDTSSTPEIGISYFAPRRYGIKSKYSIGARSFSAFIRARYSRLFKVGEWVIEPTQQFKYSTKYHFEEETNLYIDRKINKLSLFRTSLYRKTGDDIRGMDYRIAFSYYFAPEKKHGLSLTQHFWGNTRYTCLIKPEPYGGISDYVTSFRWRQQIWREWIAYEIQPAISFHRQYDYEANYMLRFNLDFYFGDI